MPRKRSRVLPQIVMVIVDHDAGWFNVVGPVADDDGISRMVVALQRKGRRVRCFAARKGRSTATKGIRRPHRGASL